MEDVMKLSQQVAKTRAKIAEYYKADEEVMNRMRAIDYNATNEDYITKINACMEATANRNRIGGSIKKMARKAIQMYYNDECGWFKFDSVFGYIYKFDQTFASWN